MSEFSVITAGTGASTENVGFSEFKNLWNSMSESQRAIRFNGDIAKAVSFKKNKNTIGYGNLRSRYASVAMLSKFDAAFEKAYGKVTTTGYGIGQQPKPKPSVVTQPVIDATVEENPEGVIVDNGNLLKTEKSNTKYWVIGGIVVVLLVGGFFTYKYFKAKKGK